MMMLMMTQLDREIDPWVRSGLPTRKRFTTLKILKFSKLMCLIPDFFKVDVSNSRNSVKILSFS